MKVMRAEETWQQAGAYYVRIQAMAKQHHMTLRQEFDEHDTPDTKYIVLLDEEFPVATCRFYELDSQSAMIWKSRGPAGIPETGAWFNGNTGGGKNGLRNLAITSPC